MSVFKAYDIRGLAGNQLDAEFARRLGSALVTHLDAESIAVARDIRESGPELHQAFLQGITEAGADVIDLGITTTGVLYRATVDLSVDAAVAITASHNPPEYNGFKICRGTLPMAGEELQKLKATFDAGEFHSGSGTITEVPEFEEQVLQTILENAGMPQRSIRVAIDCGNAVPGPLTVSLMQKLGVDLVPIHCDWDNTFPNHPPDPTRQKNMVDLSKAVVENYCEFGIGMDGDGDRIGVVDEQGRFIHPDRLMAVIAADVLVDRRDINLVASDQLKKVNSNTRYLHPLQTEFAEKILSKLPSEFEVCYFVNSGSEANELALRLAQAHTHKTGIITPDEGYFGNTTGALSISAYKFKKPNGVGQADWVEIIEVPDDYRGSFKKDDPDRSIKYANFVDGAIESLNSKGHGLSGFIMETFPSVGGQIIPPEGYLAQVYSKIRKHGGVCIADEVQTGLGRLGDYYFGFEFQKVIPDIVVLGKPLGNGHPIGAVITTKTIAQSFDNGIEFFSTFGGSNLSCRIGKEVLEIVDEEKLQSNAKIVGDFLLAGFREL